MALHHHRLQMSWQPSLLSLRRKTGPPLGLRNLGNSCYLNSVLQCLTYTPPLANFCLRNLHSSLCDSSADVGKKRDCPFCILEKRIARSLRADHPQDAPAKIQSCLRLYAEHFRCGLQEDAHEFLRYVIDACHNTCLRLKKLLLQQQHNGTEAPNCGDTIVKEIFGGALQSQVKCLSCGAESNKVDDIMDISLDVLQSSSIHEALHKFFQPEVLDGNNKYKCENCKKLVVARKQMSVFQAPNVLVIQFKRFEGLYGGKIDKAITFEEVLVLSSFMCKESQDTSPEYNLFGTIVHAGCSPDSGHYYAYIKDASGRWYCCNDAYVSLATLDEVLSEKVYILFFSRTKQRSTSANAASAANGVKSRDLNGTKASKKQASALPPKPTQLKPLAENSSWKGVSASSNGDKVSSGARMKFSIAGNIGSKRGPAVSNGKVHALNNQFGENNGDIKGPVPVNKCDKDLSTSINRNGTDKENMNSSNGTQVIAHSNHNNLKVGDLNGDKSQVRSSPNGNGTVGTAGPCSVKSHLHERDGRTHILGKGRGFDQHELQNGCSNHPSDVSRSKRKLQDDSCILLAQDAQSRAKVEELKEILKNEASSVLQSCGWADDVYTFMCTNKRMCMSKADDSSLNFDQLRKQLIADAKPTFISQIPESLKEKLIGHLQSFSQEKGS
ncbi:ubiquitin carboxyl-terminal hydrolase 25 [Rhodamnia argentea]|uniref:Ubiquitin carboxyl-terminal hydrolase n=1 Tax=Rhodamnia argentea TaxID=178133 RepID=A0A8B8QYH4_9MYRT|nr:ubiquitin carboxyl-terminal hydrolase 25 [Rhodamnia argentea]